jgi:YesN/AraC family two-component response regulator
MDGYVGGSTFERIQSEKVITNITHAFKELDFAESEDLMVKMLDGITKHYEYVDFIKKYIAEHYQQPISLGEIAEIAHVSPSHISRLFKKEVGSNFRTYLMEYRMHQAAKLFQEKPFKCAEVAKLVGYDDYFQFSKIFKKVMGMNPRDYQRLSKNKAAHKK